MRIGRVMSVFILVAIVGGIVSADDSAGKLVFAIREPFQHEDGFRAATRSHGRKVEIQKNGGSSISITSAR